MKKKRIALIGLGGISQSVHLPIISRLHDRVELGAVVDLSAQRAADVAREMGKDISAYTSVGQMLDDPELEGLDGAVVATTGSHAEVVRELLQAGIPVLAEKPLALSLREHAELAQEFPGISEMLRVGYMKEYDPASRAAKKLIESLEIIAVEVEVLHPQDAAQIEFANLRSAAGDVSAEALSVATSSTANALENVLGQEVIRNSAGDLDRLYPNVVLGSVIHDIALLRYLVGGIGTVESAEHYGDKFPGSLFMRGTLAEKPAPWTLNWHFIPDYPRYEETVTIHHTAGTLKLVFDVPYLLNVATKLQVRSAVDSLGVDESTQTWPQQEAFVEEWLSFLQLISGDLPITSGLAESEKDIRVGQKMLQKIAESKGISFSMEAEAASA